MDDDEAVADAAHSFVDQMSARYAAMKGRIDVLEAAAAQPQPALPAAVQQQLPAPIPADMVAALQQVMQPLQQQLTAVQQQVTAVQQQLTAVQQAVRREMTVNLPRQLYNSRLPKNVALRWPLNADGQEVHAAIAGVPLNIEAVSSASTAKVNALMAFYGLPIAAGMTLKQKRDALELFLGAF